MSSAPSLPMAAALLVPHRPPMLLVSELVACDGDDGEAVARLDASCPFATADGLLQEVALVELMAQTCAAAQGYRALSLNQPPRVGYLVGVSKTELHGQLRVGETCHIHTRVLGVFGTFAVTEATVARDGQVIAKGTVKTWERDSDTQ